MNSSSNLTASGATAGTILPRYWLDADIARMELTASFAEIGAVLREVALRSSEKITMICGPMSSGGTTVEENLAAFYRAVGHVESFGHNVFSQKPGQDACRRHWNAWRDGLPKGTAKEAYCWDLLHHVYEELYRSGHVRTMFFMPTWATSVGATWEHGIAASVGIEIQYLPHDWDAGAGSRG